MRTYCSKMVHICPLPTPLWTTIIGTYFPDGGPCRGCPDGYTTLGNGSISADNCTGKMFSLYSIEPNHHESSY